jgi:hypothetical protein
MPQPGHDLEYYGYQHPGDRVDNSEDTVVSLPLDRGKSVYGCLFAAPLQPPGRDDKQRHESHDHEYYKLIQASESIGGEQEPGSAEDGEEHGAVASSHGSRRPRITCHFAGHFAHYLLESCMNIAIGIFVGFAILAYPFILFNLIVSPKSEMAGFSISA